MALFEIHFIKIEYIYLILFILVDGIYTTNETHFVLKQEHISNGISIVFSVLGNLTFRIPYFISKMFSIKKTIIRQNNIKFTQKIKSIVLELSQD